MIAVNIDVGYRHVRSEMRGRNRPAGLRVRSGEIFSAGGERSSVKSALYGGREEEEDERLPEDTVCHFLYPVRD